MTAAEFARLLIEALPAVAKEIRELAGIHGLDLGPDWPDMRKDMERIKAEVLK